MRRRGWRARGGVFFCARRPPPPTLASLRPRFRTVSIMPGIDTRAPDRTDTRSGLAGSPKRRLVADSSRRRLVTTSSHMPSGCRFSRLKYSTHASVVIVKPGGTGMPRLVISARSHPFPPRRSRIPADPSAFPPPKKYTYLTIGRDLPLVGRKILINLAKSPLPCQGDRAKSQRATGCPVALTRVSSHGFSRPWHPAFALRGGCSGQARKDQNQAQSKHPERTLTRHSGKHPIPSPGPLSSRSTGSLLPLWRRAPGRVLAVAPHDQSFHGVQMIEHRPPRPGFVPAANGIEDPPVVLVGARR